jgi:hypothetical protein
MEIRIRELINQGEVIPGIRIRELTNRGEIVPLRREKGDTSMDITKAEIQQMVAEQIGPVRQLLLAENTHLRSQLGIPSADPVIQDRIREENKRVNEGLADIFIGPKFAKGSVDESVREARKAARKTFIEGRR